MTTKKNSRDIMNENLQNITENLVRIYEKLDGIEERIRDIEGRLEESKDVATNYSFGRRLTALENGHEEMFTSICGSLSTIKFAIDDISTSNKISNVSIDIPDLKPIIEELREDIEKEVEVNRTLIRALKMDLANGKKKRR